MTIETKIAIVKDPVDEENNDEEEDVVITERIVTAKQ